jgi:ubiquinone/menaquinone biosynthesis C-methylase UbiE
MQPGCVERYYKFHARLYDWTRPFFLFDRKKAIDALRLAEGNTVIDIGCGTGMNIPYLLEKKANVIGVDYSFAMLERARRKFPSVKFIQADAATFSYPEPVDAILCTYVLSIVEEWQQMILRMKQMLKSSGRLVILDFHPWQDIAQMFYPPFRWWLHLHGVDPEKEYVPFIKQHFFHVEVQVNKFGYDYIIRADSRS